MQDYQGNLSAQTAAAQLNAHQNQQLITQSIAQPQLSKNQSPHDIQQRTSFMKPEVLDPMRKREEFAVSLRKEKKEKIIRERRKRLMLSTQPGQEASGTEETSNLAYSDSKIYTRCPLFIEESNLAGCAGGEEIKQQYSLKEIINRMLPQLPENLPRSAEPEDRLRVKIKQVQLLLSALFDNSQQTTASPVDQLALIVSLRKCLSESRDILIDQIHGATPIVYHIKALLNWLNNGPVQADKLTSQIQYYFEQEISWIVVNLGQGSHNVVNSLLYDTDNNVMIPSQVVTTFLSRSLLSKDPSQLHMALWFASNICGEGAHEVARLVAFGLGFDIFKVLYDVMNNEQIKKQNTTAVMWVLQNLARSDCLPKSQEQWKCLRYILRASLSLDHKEMISDALMAWKEFVSKERTDEENMRLLIDADTVKRILVLIQTHSVLPSQSFELGLAVHILSEVMQIANISDQMRAFFESNGLDKLNLVLQNSSEDIRIVTLWCLSNIACESHHTALAVAENDIFNSVVEKIGTQESFEVRKEALFVIGNVLTEIQSEYLGQLLEHYDDLLMKYLKGMTMISNAPVVMSILDTIEHFGKVDLQEQSQGKESLLLLIQTAGGFDLLEELQKAPNMVLCERAAQIIEKYIGIDESETVQTMQMQQPHSQAPSTSAESNESSQVRPPQPANGQVTFVI